MTLSFYLACGTDRHGYMIGNTSRHPVAPTHTASFNHWEAPTRSSSSCFLKDSSCLPITGGDLTCELGSLWWCDEIQENLPFGLCAASLFRFIAAAYAFGVRTMRRDYTTRPIRYKKTGEIPRRPAPCRTATQSVYNRSAPSVYTMGLADTGLHSLPESHALYSVLIYQQPERPDRP